MTTTRKPKIFIFCQPLPGGDVLAMALAEDGTGLANHLCSNAVYAKYDMGLNSRRKHQFYEEHYPEGYELVDYTEADDAMLEHDAVFVAAYMKNRELDEQEAEESSGQEGSSTPAR